MLSKEFKETLEEALKSGRYITFLVGAGISAESGIPTFRGPEGYWKVGSVNYKPQEIGTYKMFLENPLEVWKWFLFRKTVCRKAEPNPGHYALAELEELLGDRFALITQNVDGLHIRAGNTPERIYAIHGDLSYARCGDECTEELYPFPDHISKTREEELGTEEIESLKCPKCCKFLRPHVLWFDEYYNEEQYKSTSAMYIAYHTAMLFVVGTSGATTLPHRIFEGALVQQASIAVIDISTNVFFEVADEDANGHAISGKSGKVLPEILKLVKELME